MTCPRLAVFASGGGSNFQSMLNAHARRELLAEPVALLANRHGAGALKRAQDAGLQTAVFGKGCWGDVAPRIGEVLDWLAGQRIDMIALAGFLKRIPPKLLEAYPGRVLNIHPALLPDFGGAGMYGLHVHQAVLDAGKKESGATIHLVDEAYDRGPILIQEKISIEDCVTADEIARRVLEVEHRLYPRAINEFVTRTFTSNQGRTNS
jgi:formyltetrahydrofolate-dependent phosphoribosylglycinamide formyltransferase